MEGDGMNETNEMRGQLTLRVSDRDGRVVREQPCQNRIVTSGRQLVAQLFGGVESGTPPTPVTHMAVGIGSDTPQDDDGALQDQRGNRKEIGAVQYIRFADPNSNGVMRVRSTLTAEFGYDEANGQGADLDPLREAGMFNAATDGVMYNRVVFPAVTKTDAFKLTLIWDVVF
jgi:hypothetical protein